MTLEVSLVEVVKGLKWGINELDNLLGPIERSSLIVVSGHPGAGKTTLATNIAYYNAVKHSVRTLHISLAETKEKYFKYMGALGLNMGKLEEKGLFKFVELPTLGTDVLREYFTSGFIEDVSKYDPDFIIIDSITPFLQSMPSELERRAILHSGLYSIVSKLGKTVLLIADLPYGEKHVKLGGIEFIADVVLVIRIRNEGGLPSRWLQIRKVRGRRLPVYEVPFVIIPGKVLNVVSTPSLVSLMVRGHEVGRQRVLRDEVLSDIIGPTFKGTQVLILYQTGSDIPLRGIAYLVCKAVERDAKVMITTLTLDPSKVKFMLATYLSAKTGINLAKAMTLINRHVEIKARDVLVKPVSQLFGEALKQVEEIRPDIIIVPDTRVYFEVMKRREDLINRLYYMFVMLDRAYGATTIRFMGVDSGYIPSLLSELSDVVIRIAKKVDSKEPIYDVEFLKTPFELMYAKILARKLSEELGRVVLTQEMLNTYMGEAQKILQTS
ncbi:MAG: hypothetical protein DRO18_00530 [Thermoprotei archaeon]|nr:MAG: hypothetical protein DRO18_00530 [Thermoprotei archaeon]